MSKLARIFILITVTALAAGPLIGAPSTLEAAGVAIAAPAERSPSPLGDASALLYLLPALGAIRIKDTGSIAKKFVTRAGAAQGDYKEGVGMAGADWEKNTRDGEDNYKQAVTQAAAEGRFGRGVAAAGQQKFVNRATTLGAQRYGPGVQASEAEYSKGVQPYLDALKGLELPPKRPRGQNAGRANAVADRLHQMRVGK